MADNPKSLASLADDLERYAGDHATPGTLAHLINRLIEAAAALRAPTIARPVTDEMVEAALRAYATSPHLRELEQPFSSAPGPHDSEQARHDMRLAIEAALATPSPTIAALEPLQLTESEAAELDAFRAKPSRAEGLTFTPVPTIAAPSPSNEPAVEWVMCAVRDAMREHNFVVERGSDLWNRLRRHIEVALDGWHDGAGQ